MNFYDTFTYIGTLRWCMIDERLSQKNFISQKTFDINSATARRTARRAPPMKTVTWVQYYKTIFAINELL